MANDLKKVDAGELTEIDAGPLQELDQSLQPVDAGELVPVDAGELQPIESADVGSQMQSIGSVEDLGIKKTFMDEVSEFVQHLGIGVQETVAPTTIGKEEVKQRQAADTDWEDIAAEMIGSIGSDLAAAAASAKVAGVAGAGIGSVIPGVGTAIGGAVGTVAGLLGYAIYSGHGQEKLAEARSGEYSTTRALGRMALAVNPIARYNGALAKSLARVAPKSEAVFKAAEKTLPRIARAGAQVAGETAVVGSEMGAEAASMAGLLSLAAHSIGFKNSAVVTPSTSLQTGQIINSKEGRAAAANTVNKLKDKTFKYTPDEMNLEFASFLLGGDEVAKKAPTAIAKAQRIMKQVDNPDELFANYQFVKEFENELKEAGAEVRSRLKRGNSKLKDTLQPQGAFATTVQDGQIVTQELDRVFKMGATKTLNEISHAKGRFDNAQLRLDKMADKAYGLQKKVGISDDAMGQLRAYLSEGKPKHLRDKISKFLNEDDSIAPKYQPAVEAWSDVFRAAKHEMRKAGVDVNEINTYMPKNFVNRVDAAGYANEFIAELDLLVPRVGNEKVGSWKIGDLTEAGLSEAEATDFMKQIHAFRKMHRRFGTSKEFNLKQAAELPDLLESGSDISMNPFSGLEVSALFSREAEDIPEHLREFNIRQSYLNYVNSNVRQAIMHKSLMMAEAQQRALVKAQVMPAAKWWGKVIEDSAGATPRDAFSRVANKLEFAIRKGLKKNNSSLMEKGMWHTLDFAAEAISAMGASFYPSVMALNVPALTRNLSQTLAMTAPEIGGSYGYTLALRSLGGDIFKHMKRLEAEGLLSPGNIERGLNPQRGKMTQFANRVGQTLMKTYQSTDTLNRLWTYEVGQIMAQDLATGKAGAIKAIERMSPSLKSDLMEAGLTTFESFQKNQDQLGDIIGKHLIGKTQLHYGIEQRSEFLRLAGPLFSMFSKWPAAVASDVYTILRKEPGLQKKLTRFMGKYGSIYVAALAGKELMEEADSELLKNFIGDPESWAPLTSATVLLDPAVKPAVAIPSGVVETAAMRGGAAGVKKAVKEVMKVGVPGASAVLNALDRYQRNAGETKVSTEILDKVFD